MKIIVLAICVFVVSGCSATLTPELIEALAKDEASFCAYGDVRGGAGGLSIPSVGGYGQATTAFCRSNKPNAKVTIAPDGSISIEHGGQE